MLYDPSTYSRPREFAPMEHPSDTAFDRCERISPVAILYGSGARLHLSEQNSSRRLLKELWRLGRKGIELRGMISELGALDRASVRALNCYLRHYYGQISLNRLRAGHLHRYAWQDLQRAAALRWIR